MKRIFTITAPDKNQYQLYAESLEEAKVRYMEKCAFKMEALDPVTVYDKLWNFMHTHAPGHTHRKECIDLLTEFANEAKGDVPLLKPPISACNNQEHLTPEYVHHCLTINPGNLSYNQCIDLINRLVYQDHLRVCSHPTHKMWKLLWEAYNILNRNPFLSTGISSAWIIGYKKFHQEHIQYMIDPQNWPL